MAKQLALLAIMFAIAGCRDRDEGNAPTVRGKPEAQPRVPKRQCEPGPGSATAVCNGDNVVSCTSDGRFGATIQTCKDGCKNGVCIDPCAAKDVELVYVVDDENNLLSFDPKKLPDDPFHTVGKLACDKSATPFSMAVDRRGIAWVLYNNGKVYRVSIIDAHCSLSGSAPEPNAPKLFGMGFVSEGPNSDNETLFVASNDEAALATVDTSADPPRYKVVGLIDAKQTENPELTGTGDGKLYGFFPEKGNGFISELDRTGKPVGQRFQLGGSGAGKRVNAYAFAHWGGVFYVFVTLDGNSTVQAVNRKTGKHELVREKLAHQIVGAGVSTCAPLLERAP